MARALFDVTGMLMREDARCELASEQAASGDAREQRRDDAT